MSVSNLDDLKSRRLWTACLAELIGTMLLVLIACGACYGGNVVQIALSFGFTVATVVWAIGHVSGGHINPAVTMGFIAARRMTIVRGLLYMVAQTLGALAGAGILKALSPDNTPQGTVGISDNNGVSVGQGFGIELMISFVLVFVVFSCVDSQRSDLGGSVPLTVGLSIAICHLWAVDRTGSGMNPARALGPAVVNNVLPGYFWIYWVGPLVGAIIAALLYEFLFATNATPLKVKAFFTPGYDDANFDRFGRKPDTDGEHAELKGSP